MPIYNIIGLDGVTVIGTVNIAGVQLKSVAQLASENISPSTRVACFSPAGTLLGYALVSQLIPSVADEQIDDRVAALLKAGANITLTYNDVTNELTIASTGGGGGGGITQSYLGTINEAARTAWRAITPSQIYAQKITLAAAGMVADVQGWFDADASNVYTLGFGIWSDASGLPSLLLAASNPIANAQYLPVAARWLSAPINRWLPAGDYWIGFINRGGGAGNQIGDVGVGTDRLWTAGLTPNTNTWLADAVPGSATGYDPVSCGRDLLLRATIIR